ncbi:MULTISPECIES: LysR family transcriptional regulator [unclassified Streptomyces]|uniref:LysR family transcriptional regulator n=1 Tax=unclassified Streptomyces TaxID=2593676 RepID=UPI002E80FEAB|nr:LysR substrate-binding domain-containing protein [Streptomyces sp. NBC_00566]WUB90241.1 LysR substrate-binding domain-containing protein [Streptomyces sp. NBC_00566]
MEIRQLRYFIAVAQEANFTRAAELVHISQPGISAQIRQLENDLGATLIDRSGRSAQLTAVGEVVLAHAKSVLSSMDSLRQAVDEMNGLVRGKLVVGMVTACTVQPLFDALSGFHLAHPGVEISLVEADSVKLVEYVREGTVDLALIGAAHRAPEDLDGWQIISEPIVAAVPHGHPLAEKDGVTLAELSAYPIVCLPAGTGIRATLDEASAALGVTPTIALQASAPGAVMNLAERGLGVAVLSESMTAQQEGLKTIAITDADVPAVLALISAPTKSPALRELLLHCRQSFGEPAASQAVASMSGA